MAVPKYDWWYRPLLHQLADGQMRRLSELFEPLAVAAKLSDADRAQMLPSGGFTYQNRIGWARTFLKKAGLLEAPKWGYIRITRRGLDALASGAADINDKWLMQFPEFAAWARPPKPAAGGGHGTAEEAGASVSDETPAESLQRLHEQLHQALADDLLDRVKQVSPAYFERIVVDLMLAMGYGGSRPDAGKPVGQSGDGGIDGIIDEDRLGLDKIYLQAKRWNGVVGRPIVQAFSGALDGQAATKGVLITTSTFSNEAREYVHKISKKIVLVDGVELASLMIQHGVGVSVERTYAIKRIDSDYFDPE